MSKLLQTILAVALAASAAVAGAQNAPKALASNDYKLGAGDTIKIQVYQNPDLSMEARVSESGSISYPLVGSVSVGGLTISDAEKKIAAALKQKDILKQPQVNINVAQVRGNQVSVVGQVNRPGRIPLETFNMRVSEVIAAAGGISPTGDETVVVSGMRNGQPFRKEVDLGAMNAGQQVDDVIIMSGDTISVNKAPTYYVYGEAQKPGAYKVERGMTVMQALAASGGPTPRGTTNRLKLTRTGPNGQQVEMQPRMNDVVQPGDVLFVRESLF
ncbi:polysaccharide export protein EpsE [Caenimonas aquaedulcis]|uniref:Polysaccharide export protein EpsE n=1 Tax=Caenimonas aquaedulcis TaxID=2793270 RepID=A0A931MIF5_9BURK|nr:polysaccharide export protein EpsE [Caenimonas aquaedulcis]MBG9390076.1 polysaccharide export protein EpsE [Caenimonas aquaedulcis]